MSSVKIIRMFGFSSVVAARAFTTPKDEMISDGKIECFMLAPFVVDNIVCD